MIFTGFILCFLRFNPIFLYTCTRVLNRYILRHEIVWSQLRPIDVTSIIFMVLSMFKSVCGL